MLTVFLALAAAASFDPIRFFSGCTHGEGQLKALLHSRQRVTVNGKGRIAPDGSLVLVQRVQRGQSPPVTREWRLRQITPLHYVGTLSDARGDVVGETIGNRLHLAFTGRDGFQIEQWLTLAEDGESAANVLTAKRAGIVVARLHERIVRTSGCDLSAVQR
jgi:hypothetical protein